MFRFRSRARGAFQLNLSSRPAGAAPRAARPTLRAVARVVLALVQRVQIALRLHTLP